MLGRVHEGEIIIVTSLFDFKRFCARSQSKKKLGFIIFSAFLYIEECVYKIGFLENENPFVYFE